MRSIEFEAPVNNWTKIVQMLRKSCQKHFKSSCYFCHQADLCEAGICETCLDWLPWMPAACRYCGLPMTTDNASICGLCFQAGNYALDAVKVLFRYEDPIRSLVLALKYQQKLYVGKMLGSLMAEYLKPNRAIAGIMPVPLATGRLQQRGFNQCLEIARIIAKSQKIPLIRDGMLKTRETKNQSELNGTSRKQNLKLHNFSYKPKFVPESIIIIDDVMTTGTTIKLVAQKLRQAGVKHIEGWLVCRAVL
jgi:ComF family protein